MSSKGDPNFRMQRQSNENANKKSPEKQSDTSSNESDRNPHLNVNAHVASGRKPMASNVSARSHQVPNTSTCQPQVQNQRSDAFVAPRSSYGQHVRDHDYSRSENRRDQPTANVSKRKEIPKSPLLPAKKPHYDAKSGAPKRNSSERPNSAAITHNPAGEMSHASSRSSSRSSDPKAGITQQATQPLNLSRESSVDKSPKSVTSNRSVHSAGRDGRINENPGAARNDNRFDTSHGRSTENPWHSDAAPAQRFSPVRQVSFAPPSTGARNVEEFARPMPILKPTAKVGFCSATGK